MELDNYLVKLVGEDAAEVVLITDSELDINTSSVTVQNITFADFAPLGSVKSLAREQTEPIALAPHCKEPRGVYIQIKESLKEPLHLVFEANEEFGGYVFLEVADHVEATIIEHHTYCNCACCPTGNEIPITVEGVFGQGSKISYNAFDVSHLNLVINRSFATKRDAEVYYAAGMFGTDCKSDTVFHVRETGADIESKTMMFVKDEATQIHRIRINHYADHTKSYMRNHGVVAGSGRGEFENVGFIEQGATQADAQQESRIMTLDEAAKAFVHPILLIDEYDVVAGHAGSVGRASDEALYYLQSRGLTKREAQLLITEGFLRPVVEDITDAFTKQRIEKEISTNVGYNQA